MKTAILYKTMTGCTQKYAEILSEKLQADIFKFGRIGTRQLKTYDIVVFGGCVHGGTISGLKKFKRIAAKLEKAKLAVFAVGASDPANAKLMGDIVTKNFPEGFGQTKFFFLQGGMDLAKMKQPFKGFMKWIKKMIEMNPDKKPDEIEFLKMFNAGDDAVSEKNTGGLVSYVLGS